MRGTAKFIFAYRISMRYKLGRFVFAVRGIPRGEGKQNRPKFCVRQRRLR